MVRSVIPALIAASLALAPARPATAQSITADTAVTYGLAWDDVGPGIGAHNGVLEPGESVLFRIAASFTNQNTVGAFTPPIGGFSSGTIRGFGGAFIDLVGGATAQGNWDVDPAHGYGVAWPWNILGSGGNGVPNSDGTHLDQVQFGQFPLTPQEINTTNPIVDVFSALWTPTSYDVRTVLFQLAGDPAGAPTASYVLFELGPTEIGGVYCPSNFGSVQVNVGIPEPAVVASLVLAAGVGLRRTRHDRLR